MVYAHTFSFIIGSLAYNYILKISGWFSVKFNNTFVFTHPEQPIINIMHGLYEICGQFLLCLVFFHLYNYQN